MKDKTHVSVEGNEKDLEDFTKMLKGSNIPFSKEKKEEAKKEVSRDVWAHMPPDLWWQTVVGVVVVEATKELVKAIIKWLKERKEKGLKKPRLKVTVEGNVVNLNVSQMKILEKVLEKASKEKGKTRRRRVAGKKKGD